jgi:hypothetical protein
VEQQQCGEWDQAVRRPAEGDGHALYRHGIRGYLLLLSLNQTLRYQNLSFWRFLLSKETDITAFANRRR